MAKSSRTYSRTYSRKRRTKPSPFSSPFAKQYPSIRTLIFFYALCFLSYDLSPYAPFGLILTYKATLLWDVLSGFHYVNGGRKGSLVGRMWLDTCAAWLFAFAVYPNTSLSIVLILISGLAMVVVKHKPQWARRTI